MWQVMRTVMREKEPESICVRARTEAGLPVGKLARWRGDADCRINHHHIPQSLPSRDAPDCVQCVDRRPARVPKARRMSAAFLISG